MKNSMQDPIALAGDGAHIWFAASTVGSNNSAGAVAEFNASDGQQIWSVPATIYNDQQGETSAVSIAYADGRLWIANGQSVTELNASTGKPIRVLSGEAYHFTGEPAIAVAGTHVFVVNGDGNSVTEIDASTGVLVHTLTAPRYHLDNPVGIAVVGNRAWILNSPLSGASSVVELALSAGCSPNATETISPIPDTDTFGIGKVEDLSWKGMLDLGACTECGRCQSPVPRLGDRQAAVPQAAHPRPAGPRVRQGPVPAGHGGGAGHPLRGGTGRGGAGHPGHRRAAARGRGQVRGPGPGGVDVAQLLVRSIKLREAQDQIQQ